MSVGNEDDKIPDMGEEQRTGLSIGPALRSAREKRGLSLEEVEQATKIRPRYLEGLEREDYSMLPAPIYVRGFLKTYATFLSLDGEALSETLRETQSGVQETQTDHIHEGNPEDPSGSGEPLPHARALSGTGGGTSSMVVPFFAIAGVLLLVLVGVLYFVGRELPAFNNSGRQANHDNAGFVSKDRASRGSTPVSKPIKKKREAVRGTKSSAVAGTTDTNRAVSTLARTDQGPLQANIKVVGAVSWIEVSADGIISYSHLTQPGFSQTFEAKRRVVVFTGNAGAVRVSLNGQDLGALGQDGQVLKKVYTVKKASSGG